LRDYLLQVGSCQTRQELMHTACVEMQSIIPHDQTAGIFDSSDQRNIEGFGKSDSGSSAAAGMMPFWEGLWYG
jgi:hypothetical protein